MVHRIAQQTIQTIKKILPAALILLLAASITANIQFYKQVGLWMEATHLARWQAHEALDQRDRVLDRCTGMTGY